MCVLSIRFDFELNSWGKLARSVASKVTIRLRTELSAKLALCNLASKATSKFVKRYRRNSTSPIGRTSPLCNNVCVIAMSSSELFPASLSLPPSFPSPLELPIDPTPPHTAQSLDLNAHYSSWSEAGPLAISLSISNAPYRSPFPAPSFPALYYSPLHILLLSTFSHECTAESKCEVEKK